MLARPKRRLTAPYAAWIRPSVATEDQELIMSARSLYRPSPQICSLFGGRALIHRLMPKRAYNLTQNDKKGDILGASQGRGKHAMKTKSFQQRLDTAFPYDTYAN